MSNTRSVSFLGGIALLACSLGPSIATATPITLVPTTAVGFGQDDWNTSTLIPNNPTGPGYFSNLKKILGAQGQGPGGQGFNAGTGWNFSQANAADTASVESDLTIDNYYAWVVNSPNLKNPDGIPAVPTDPNFPFKNEDVGGAVFSMIYDPFHPNGNDPTDVQFIQVYGESVNGGAITYHVDGTDSSPFYGGAVQTLHNKTQWFLDEPYQCENPDDCSAEGKEDANVTVYFGVFVATDNVVGDVNNVKIYGGELWGFHYTTSDTAVPEPSAAILTGAGMLALLGLGRAGRKLQRKFQG